MVKHRGMSLEEIALRENVTIESIQESVDRAEAYKYRNSEEIVQAKYFEMSIEVLPSIQKVLNDAMTAVHVLEDGTEKTDHRTQLEAVSKVKDFLEIFQKKGGGINVGINNNVNAAPSYHGRSLEGIVRAENAKREAKSLPLPMDDEILDAEEIGDGDPEPVEDDVPLREYDEDEGDDAAEDKFAEN